MAITKKTTGDAPWDIKVYNDDRLIVWSDDLLIPVNGDNIIVRGVTYKVLTSTMNYDTRVYIAQTEQREG